MRLDFGRSSQLNHTVPVIDNRTRAFGVIRRFGPVTKADVARLSGLSLPAVGRVIAELEATGLVDGISPPSTSRGGRPAAQYRVSGRDEVVVAFDLSGYEVVAGVLRPDGSAIRIDTLSLSSRGDSLVTEFMDRLAGYLSGLGPRQILGVGVAVPGLLDRRTGFMRYSSPLGLRGVPLSDLLSRRLGHPVVVRKETETAIRGEYFSDSELSQEGLLYVRMALGVGVGVLLGGRVYTGVHDMSGEVGHTVVDPEGPACDCGNSGCLEQVASVTAMVRDARDLYGDRTLSAQAFLAKAARGDPPAMAVLQRAAGHLARAVYNLVRLFDPGEVIVAGPFEGGEEGEAAFFEAMLTYLRRFRPLGGVDTPVRRSRLGRVSSLVGLCVEITDMVLRQRLQQSMTPAAGARGVRWADEGSLPGGGEVRHG